MNKKMNQKLLCFASAAVFATSTIIPAVALGGETVGLEIPSVPTMAAALSKKLVFPETHIMWLYLSQLCTKGITTYLQAQLGRCSNSKLLKKPWIILRHILAYTE